MKTVAAPSAAVILNLFITWPEGFQEIPFVCEESPLYVIGQH